MLKRPPRDRWQGARLPNETFQTQHRFKASWSCLSFSIQLLLKFLVLYVTAVQCKSRPFQSCHVDINKVGWASWTSLRTTSTGITHLGGISLLSIYQSCNRNSCSPCEKLYGAFLKKHPGRRLARLCKHQEGQEIAFKYPLFERGKAFTPRRL